MNTIWKTLSAIGIGLTVLPSFFVFAGTISWGVHANLMLAGTILWFATSPLWMEVAATALPKPQAAGEPAPGSSSDPNDAPA